MFHFQQETKDDYYITEGKFTTPLSKYLPGIVSPEIEDAYFQMIIPKKWKSENFKPVCIHLAGTGDHVRFVTNLYYTGLYRLKTFVM